MSNFLMPVELYMSAPVLTVKKSDTLVHADEKLRAHRISSLAVVDATLSPVGVLSRTDLIRVGRIQSGRRPKSASLVLPDKTVGEVMTTGVTTVSSGDSVRSAAKKLIDARVHRLFVVDGERLVGVLSTKDIMLAIGHQQVREPISAYMSAPLVTIRAQEPIAMANERLEKAHVSGVVVTDEGWPVGMFTQEQSLLSAEMARDTPVEEVMSHSLVCMNVDTHVHRAAAQAAETRTRRVVVVENRRMRGILTGVDFARATQ